MGEEQDKESMMGQASRIWSMLDDMSENDPSAYRKFIDKQMADAKEMNKPPEPDMCILTALLEPTEVRLYLNVCGYQRVPKPKSDDDPVPVISTAVEIQKDDGGSYKTVGVAFHSSVISKYGSGATNSEYTECLVSLAMDFLEEQLKNKLRRSYSTLPVKTTRCKGPVESLHAGFRARFKNQDEKMDKEMEDLQNNFSPLAAAQAMAGGGGGGGGEGQTTSLMDQLSSLSVGGRQPPGPSPGLPGVNPAGAGDLSDLRLPGQQDTKGKKSKPLVEELDEPEEPKYSVKVEGKPPVQKLQVRISLPGVFSCSDCDLDVAKDNLRLEVPKKYTLDLSLPYSVDPDGARAKFKKNSTLTITAPILS